MGQIRLTMAQALVRFLDNQYIEFDGVQTRFVKGIFAIFGHGSVCGRKSRRRNGASRLSSGRSPARLDALLLERDGGTETGMALQERPRA